MFRWAVIALSFLVLWSASSAQQQRGDSGTAQLSGHVTREDDGTPISDALVMVCSSDGTIQTEHTAADGSYAITNVLPGKYLWVIANRVGFAPQRYQPDPEISVAPDQKLEIDLQLLSTPAIEPMPGDDRLPFIGVLGLSPGGTFLALSPDRVNPGPGAPIEVWLYERGMKRLLPVDLDIPRILPPPAPPCFIPSRRCGFPRPSFGFNFVWADDDVLYISYRFPLNPPSPYFRLSAIRTQLAQEKPQLATELLEPADVPEAVKKVFTDHALKEKEPFPLATDRYALTLVRPQTRGESMPLVLESKDGTVLRTIEEDFHSTFLFDQAGSTFFYDEGSVGPKPMAIRGLDLNSLSFHDTVLPYLFPGPWLGDQRKDEKGHLLVYRVGSPCLPDETFFKAAAEREVDSRKGLIPQRNDSQHICFVYVP